MLMETRTRRGITLTAMFVTSLIMLLPGAAAANAEGNGSSTPPPTTAPAAGTVATSGPVITVMVSGSSDKSGSSGSGGGGTFSKDVPVPCWMSAGDTGKAYYDWVTSGQMSVDVRHSGGGDTSPRQGYAAFKDDTKGHWYSGECSSAN